MTPLTKLFKKGIIWEWTDKCQKEFDELKTSMMKESILALPDISKLFNFQTDTSNFALGGVLLQEGHPVAFEIYKLSEAERWYTA